jgi:hypothetical protein
MSIRKDKILVARTLLAFAQLMHDNAEINHDLLEPQIAILKEERASDYAKEHSTETQVTAESQSMEPRTVPNGATWENPHTATQVDVSLERMEEIKNFLEEVVHGLEGADEALKTLESRDEEPTIEPIGYPRDPGDRMEDLKLAELQAVRNQEQDSAEYSLQSDAEMATAAIEELTVKLEHAISEQTKEAEQENAALSQEFKDEQDELAGKLDKMRDKYFQNHPDLPADQRTDAEDTFKTIKDEAIGALKTQQDSRLVELQAQQQDLSDNYERAQKELDETRDERD